MKTISTNDKLALIGLLTLGENLNKQLREIEKAMLKLTGEKSGVGMGHCSDTLYGVDATSNKEEDVELLLKSLGITVKTN